MKAILVLAEHRQGQWRDITFEMLCKGRQVAERLGSEVHAVVLGKGIPDSTEALRSMAHKVLFVQDERLDVFNSDTYQTVLARLITERKPLLTLIGHSTLGMDLAPNLAVQLKMPLATDCIGVDEREDTFVLTRQIYGGKINSIVSFNRPGPYLVTLRAGAFPVVQRDSLQGDIIHLPSPLADASLAKRFLGYVEAALGDVDITQADILVSVGRGIKGPENLPLVKEFAEAVGGTLSCSRPVVDKKWLSKDRQVGTSGKTVKPKVYIALGISGAFQHIAGMKGAGTVIAINKDPKAPIFGVAHYGIVGDLFKIVPVLKDKARELKRR